MSKYIKGDILKPTNIHTGYAQIYSVQEIPENRRDMYSEDNSVKELYHIYTDFGNKFPLTGKEIDNNYTVVGNEVVYKRMLIWKENVLKVVDDYEKSIKEDRLSTLNELSELDQEMGMEY